MQVSPAKLSSYFTTRLLSQSLIASTATRILTASPDRVSVIISANIASGGVQIWPDSTLTAAKGITITAAAGQITLLFRDLGSLVSGEWWALSAGGVTISTAETLFGSWVDLGDV